MEQEEVSLEQMMLFEGEKSDSGVSWTEDDRQTIVCIEQRDKYRIKLASGFKRLSNSDIIYANEYFRFLKQHRFSPEFRQQFLLKKKLRTMYLPRNVCHICERPCPDTRAPVIRMVEGTYRLISG